jgi:hypothetical protein
VANPARAKILILASVALAASIPSYIPQDPFMWDMKALENRGRFDVSKGDISQ